MKILYVEPNENTMYSFRRELVNELIRQGHEVYIALKFGNRIEKDYKDKAAGLFNIDANLRSINPFTNISLKSKYKKIINSVKPEVLLTYTIKPNIYCNNYSKNCYSIANITGLGSAFDKKGILNKLVVSMYKKSFKNVDFVMFQNEANYNKFVKNNISISEHKIIPGSGVNTSLFLQKPLDNHEDINFLFASRFVKEKGIDLFLECIPKLADKNCTFTIVGNGDKEYESKINKLVNEYPNKVNWIKRTNDMPSVYEKADFTVSPSFYNEGISNILLESLAICRPIITTNDNPGCMDVLEEGINGFGVKSNDFDSLLSALNKACSISKDDIYKMGQNGRNFVENKFNRKIVIDSYISVINSIKK